MWLPCDIPPDVTKCLPHKVFKYFEKISYQANVNLLIIPSLKVYLVCHSNSSGQHCTDRIQVGDQCYYHHPRLSYWSHTLCQYLTYSSSHYDRSGLLHKFAGILRDLMHLSFWNPPGHGCWYSPSKIHLNHNDFCHCTVAHTVVGEWENASNFVECAPARV